MYTWYYLIPDTSRIRLTLHRLHNQDDLLSFAHNLYPSLINRLSIFVPFHSFPFLSHLSQRFPKFCITHQNVDKSLQLHVSICKVNHHVWSGSSFGFCGASYFFIIQSSFSYVFPMISWWFTMISLWFSHSFHVSRLRRLRHDILLWTAMMPLVTDGGMNL